MVTGPERKTMLDFTLPELYEPLEEESSESLRRTEAENFARASGASNPSGVTQSILDQFDQPSQSDIEKARNDGALWKKLLTAGNKWGFGVGKIDIKAGPTIAVPFVNPINTFWNGLKWWDQHAVDPLAGAVIGRSAVTIQGLGLTKEGAAFHDMRIDSIANDYRDVLSAGGNSWNPKNFKDSWSAYGDFNRDRESIFTGEKFFSSLLLDPTTYVGFGVLGRAPILGRVLGPVESGYIEAVNVPFKLMGRAFSKIPKTRGQNSSQVIGHTFGNITTDGVAVTNGAVNFSDANVGVTEFRAALAKIFQPSRDPKTLTEAEMRIKTMVYTRAVGEPESYMSLIKAGKGDVSLFSWTEKGTHQNLIALQDLLDAHLMGRLNIDEVVDAFIPRIAGKNDAVTRKALAKEIERSTATVVQNTTKEMASTTAVAFRSRHSVRAGEIYEQNTALGFDLWKRRQGIMGAFVGKLDDYQRKFYQNGLRRNILRPIATITLAFPGFPLQEVGESVLRQATGRSSMGFTTRNEFNRTFDAAMDVMPPSIARGDASIYASRGALNVAEDAVSLRGLIARTGRIDEFISKHGYKLKYANPMEWVRMTGEISASARRHYITNRVYQKDVQLIQRFDQNLMDLIDDVPIGGLPYSHARKVGDRMHQEMIVRIANTGGDAAAIRAVVADSFDVRDMNEREFRQIADRYVASNDFVGPEFHERLEDFIQGGGTYAQLDSFISGMSDDAFRRFVETGEGFEIGLDIAMRALKRVRMDLPGDLAISLAASRAVKPGSSLPKLPKDLSGSKPRYKEGSGPNLVPNFESDIDRALFQVTSKTKSRRHTDYVTFLRQAGIDDLDHAALGGYVRTRLKARYAEVKDQLTDGQSFNMTPTRRRDVVPTDDVPEGSIELFRGEELPVSRDVGKPQGMVARGEIDEADLQLGPGRYMTPSESEAATFGPVTRQYLAPNARILDLDAPLDYDDAESLNRLVDMGFNMPESNVVRRRNLYNVDDEVDEVIDDYDSVGEFYYRLQDEYTKLYDGDAAKGKAALNEDLEYIGFGAIKSTDPMDEYLILNERFLKTAPDLSDAPLGGRAHDGYDLGPDKFGEGYVGLGDDAAGQVDAASVDMILMEAERTFNDLASRIDQINQTYIKAARRLGDEEKVIHFEKNRQEIEELMNRVTDKMPMWIEEIRLAEEAVGFTGGNAAKFFETRMEDLRDTWAQDRLIWGNTQQLHKTTSRGRRPAAFWDEFYAQRSALWTDYTTRSNARYAEADRLSRERGRTMGRPDADSRPKVKRKDFKNRVLKVEDIAYIVGRQSNNVTQALVAANFRSREGFETYVMNKAREYGHAGVRRDRVGVVYDEVLKSLGFEAGYHTAFDASRRNIKEFGEDLKTAFKAPSFNETHRDAFDEWAERIAQHAETIPAGERGILKFEGRKRVEEAVEEHNGAFVNYDGGNAADDLTQGLFPYITYETRRLNWLLQRGFDHPAVFTTIGPEGRYWEATDNGYIHTPWDSWDLNIFGGTMLNTPRRLFKSEFPAEHQKGMRGAVSKSQIQLDRVGIYLGPAATGAMELWDQMTGSGGDFGEAAPPPLTGGLAAFESFTHAVPGLEPLAGAARTMRLQLFDDRFRDRTIQHILIDRGFDLRDLDVETMTPRNEKGVLTQEDINDASAESARQEFISESMGNVRWRGDAERVYRENREQLWGDLLGIPHSEARALASDGVRLSDLVQLSPEALGLFSLIDNSDQFGTARLDLLPEGLREMARQRNEYYGTLGAQRETFLEAQIADDALWATGDLVPILWASNRQVRMDQKANAGNVLRGITVDPAGVETTDEAAPFANMPFEYDEWVAFQNEYGADITEQRHPIQEELDVYYEIRPTDIDGDGQIDWEDFLDRQIEHEDSLEGENKRAFLEAIDDSYSPVEQAMRQFSREIARPYLQIADTLRDEQGVAKLLDEVKKMQMIDQDAAAELRSLPAYRLYTKSVREAKELMRLENPTLDYGLNIFGMLSKTTQNFLNRDAKRWYESDNREPRISRLGI